jgi:hypothetical protein
MQLQWHRGRLGKRVMLFNRKYNRFTSIQHLASMNAIVGRRFSDEFADGLSDFFTD